MSKDHLFNQSQGDRLIEAISAQRKEVNFQADTFDPGGYIGMRVEGGGTIYFDYKIGFSGSDITVPASTDEFKTYHVDWMRNVVVCDNPTDTTKKDRFYVVSDYDIGDYKRGTCLMWGDTQSPSLYNVLVGTETAFGTGKVNTQKCLEAAGADDRLEWNNNAYNNLWHYIWKGDWKRQTDRDLNQWFVPSKDELALLCNMQYAPNRRQSADGKTNLMLLPINFYPYYWSSSEASVTYAWNANFYIGGASDKSNKNSANGNYVRLVRTF